MYGTLKGTCYRKKIKGGGGGGGVYISSCAVLDSLKSLMELLPGDQIAVQSGVRFVDKRDNDVTYSPACIIACANLKPEMQCTNKKSV